MKKLKQLGRLCARFLVFGVCGFISVYLLMSGYESIYNRALPFVDTLATVDLGAFSQSYNLSAAAVQNSALYGEFGRPVTLELPNNTLRFDIVAPIREGQNGPWLARTDSLQLLIPARPRDGNIGIALLYGRSSYRTIGTNNMPSPGQNVFMETDQNWEYVYRVDDAKVYPSNEPYILGDDGSTGMLIIDCYNSSNHTNIIIGATLLSVQGEEQ